MNIMNAFKSTGEVALIPHAIKLGRLSMQAMRDKARFQGFKAATTKRKPIRKPTGKKKVSSRYKKAT